MQTEHGESKTGCSHGVAGVLFKENAQSSLCPSFSPNDKLGKTEMLIFLEGIMNSPKARAGSSPPSHSPSTLCLP